MRAIVEWPQPRANLGQSVYYQGNPVPIPNFSRPLDVKLGRWIVPTGASRWAYGFFLVDWEHLFGGTTNVSASQSILGQVGNGGANNPQALVIEGPSGYRRTWSSVYMLPPHPVSAVATGSTGYNPLWLIALVDERFYWQTATCVLPPIAGAIANAPNGGLDWSTYFTYVSTTAGAVVTPDTPWPAYQKLNGFFFAGATPFNVAHMLDAMAASIGQRIVPYYTGFGPNTVFPGGKWRSMGWAGAQAQLKNNLSIEYDAGALQAGSSLGQYPNEAAIAPASIQVVFRKSRNGIVTQDYAAQRYVSTVTAAQAQWTYSTSQNTITVKSTALANIDPNNPANILNQATLDAIALQVATDYYSGIWIQDSCIVGVSQWQETSFDDYVEYNLGERLPDGTRISKTRIHSRPYNEQMPDMLHCDPTVWEYGDKIMGTLDGNLAAFGTQTITLTDADSAKPSGVTHITVTEVMGNPLNSGTTVQCLRYGNKWAVFEGSGGSSIHVGTCATVLTAGGSGTWTITGGTTVTASVPYGITQASTNYLLSVADDGNYYVLNPDKIFYGQFSSVVTAGNSGTLTIYDGAQGSESSTGVTVTAWVRSGTCLGSKTYIGAFTTGGYEILNPDGMLLCRCTTRTDCTSGATITALIYSGTLGSESSTGVSVSAYVRKGFIHSDTTYQLQYNSGGFEVVNPSLVIRGQPGGDIASDASGSMVVYYGTGAGTASAVTVSGIRNDSSCTLKASKLAYAEWVDSLAGWIFTAGHTT